MVESFEVDGSPRRPINILQFIVGRLHSVQVIDHLMGLGAVATVLLVG